MKKLFTVTLLFASISLFAQEQAAIPRSEYVVSVSEKLVKIAPGETKQITVSILRSKGFSKSKADLGLSSSLPAGITLQFEPAAGLFDKSTATFKADANVPVGEYQVILKSTVRNLNKGTIIKLVVGNEVSKEAVSMN
jgi:hypothetical protein